MEMEELKTLFRSHGGWTVNIHKRNKGTRYVYAYRKRGGGQKVEIAYFAPLLKAEQMSKEEVLEKLATLKK